MEEGRLQVVGEHRFEKLVDMMDLDSIWVIFLLEQNEPVGKVVKYVILLFEKPSDLFLLQEIGNRS